MQVNFQKQGNKLAHNN